MSTDISKILDIFSKFLKSDIPKKSVFSKKVSTDKLQTIDDFLKLPIYSFKFIDDQEAKILEEILDIFDIEDAAKLDIENPFNKIINHESTEDPIGSVETKEELVQQIDVLKNKFPDLEGRVKKAATISSLLIKVKEQNTVIKNSAQKVIVVGLDNAGKTAILNMFGGRLGISDLVKLTPTKGVERRIIQTEGIDLLVWDFGGQQTYRDKYLENVNQHFLEVDLLIYVIDIQDSGRFDESFSYLEDVLNSLTMLEEKPYILIFFHKYDPELVESPEINLNVEFLQDQIQELFADKDFRFDLYLTSIFTMISREPQFSKYVKELLSSNSMTDPMIKKVEGLGGIVEEIMNAIIRLSESLSLQLHNIDERLRVIESGAVKVAPGGPLNKPSQKIEQREQNVRATVLGELQDLFAKKKKLNL